MSDDYIQLIFCVESNEKAAIDSKYINEVLRKYYHVGENKISYVYMGGKHKFNHHKTITKIDKLIKEYQITGTGQSFVIYACDKDLNAQNYQDARFVEDMKKYCDDKKYYLIWFVKTIEDVMWGIRTSKNQKKQKALQFIQKHHINQVIKADLSASDNVNADHKSNILTVLNNFKQIGF